MPKSPRTRDPRHRAFCEPTKHVAAALHHAEASGLAVLTGVLDREAVARSREAVLHASAGDGETVIGDPVCRGLLEHPVALEFVTRLLGPKPRLSRFAAAIARRGDAATGMLAAQGYVTAPWPAWPLSVAILWALDACTDRNGAVRVMPDSGRYDHGPEWGLDYPEAAELLCPVGSLIVLDGRIWRQTGANTTVNEPRVTLIAHYVRPWVLPETDWRDAVPEASRATLSPGLRELLGLGDRASRYPGTRYGEQIWLNEPAPER